MGWVVGWGVGLGVSNQWCGGVCVLSNGLPVIEAAHLLRHASPPPFAGHPLFYTLGTHMPLGPHLAPVFSGRIRCLQTMPLRTVC